MGKQMIISIGREYGSGGLDIGKKIAEDFGLKFYDRNLLNAVAKEKNIQIEYLERYDEAPKHLLDSRRVGAYSNSLQEIIAEMQFEYLRERAAEGESFVVVGRCAESVLRDCEGLISIFVLGDLPFRVKRIMEEDGLSESDALTKIRRIDKKRKQYHNRHADGKWGDSRSYDICIKSSSLGVEKTIGILEDYIRTRM